MGEMRRRSSAGVSSSSWPRCPSDHSKIFSKFCCSSALIEGEADAECIRAIVGGRIAAIVGVDDEEAGPGERVRVARGVGEHLIDVRVHVTMQDEHDREG